MADKKTKEEVMEFFRQVKEGTKALFQGIRVWNLGLLNPPEEEEKHRAKVEEYQGSDYYDYLLTVYELGLTFHPIWDALDDKVKAFVVAWVIKALKEAIFSK